MKVKETTNLANYGFKIDNYAYWVLQVPGLTGKGKDKDIPVRLEIVVSPDRDIFFYTTNDHVTYPAYWETPTHDQIEEDYKDAYNFDESIDIPKALIDLIRNNEIEFTETPA